MVDFSASFPFGIALAFVLGEGTMVYCAPETPTSTPREARPTPSSL